MGRAPAKSVLVTGGFGFIGSHLVEMLSENQDVYVHVVDNMVTSPIHLPAYLGQLGHSDRVSYDLCTVREFLSRKDLPVFDEVYHLASVVGPVGVLKYGGRILQSTVDDGYAVADYCLGAKAKLCDVSTSEVRHYVRLNEEINNDRQAGLLRIQRVGLTILDLEGLQNFHG